MPRDWDLFAFAGFPLLAFVLRSLLDRKKPYLRVAILIIVVNLLVLGPRVVSQIVPDISIAHALNYKELDIQKSRPLYVSLTKILKERGDSAQERKLAAEFHERYPEFRESEYLVAQMGKRPADEIIALGRRILKRSPFTQSVWGNMGLSFVSLGMLDSAIHYYRIADALNPGTPTITSNLAAAYVRKGELDKAERLLNKAISADSTQPQFYYYKSRIAGMRGDREEYLKQLAKAASWPNSPLMYLTELSEYYLRTGDAYHARGILDTALSRGLDSAIIDSLAVRYPGQRK
jgi:predicted Zn-dependent protease